MLSKVCLSGCWRQDSRFVENWEGVRGAESVAGDLRVSVQG
jgi:hypothetical protein